MNGEEKQHFLCSILNNASQGSSKHDAQCDIPECTATSMQYEPATQARYCYEALIAFQPKSYQIFALHLAAGNKRCIDLIHFLPKIKSSLGC